MAIEWYRVYHGTPMDPKWLTIARRAKVAPGVVTAVWAALMDHASQAEPRGSVEDFDTETVAGFLGWDEDDVKRTVTQLAEKGLINNGSLAAWIRRQPKREDDSSERVRRHRERKSSNNNVAAGSSHDDGNGGNAVKRNVTPDESRVEKRRKDPPPDGSPVSPAAVTQQQQERVEVLDMRTDLSALLDRIPDPTTRRRVLASAQTLIAGDDLSAWRDPRAEGEGIPWKERPRLWKLALAKLESDAHYGSSDLRKNVKYVALCELAPLPPRRQNGDTEAARVQNETPGAGRRSKGEPKRVAQDDRVEREREAAEDRAVAEWLTANPQGKAEIAIEVTREFETDPKWSGVGDTFRAAAIEARIREKIRERLRKAAA